MSNPIEPIKVPAARLLDREELRSLASRAAGVHEGAAAEQEVAEEAWQRLKWLGVFHRRSTPGRFMLRLRVPQGILASQQLRAVAEVAAAFGDGTADLTTRQAVQVRGVPLRDVPAALERLETAGLTTLQTGMDNVRNVMGCPVAGLDPEELIDTTSVVRELNGCFVNNPDFVNLPRKFNIAVVGCREDCAHAAAQDVGLVPAAALGGREVRGFNVLVGGALGSAPARLASPLDVFVTPEEAAWLCRLIVEIFRDHGPREHRHRARLKFLLEAWGLPKFKEALEARAGRPLPPAGRSLLTAAGGSHLGFHPQKQPGRFYLGLPVPVGRVTATRLREAARLADLYGTGTVRLTPDQDLILTDIPAHRLESLRAEPLVRELGGGAPRHHRVVSCTGNRFCSFALIDTKGWALALDRSLEAAGTWPETVRIRFSGCPHSCGQHQIADIGFLGGKARVDGRAVETVDVFLGGCAGPQPRLGEKVLEKLPCHELPSLVEALGTAFREGRENGESFGDYIRRRGARRTLESALSAPTAGVAGR